MRNLLLISLAVASAAASAQFTSGNLVVAVVGDGNSNVTGNLPVALREYTVTGTRVGTDLSLTNINGRNLTATYGETSEAGLELSRDRRFLMIPGYDLAPRSSGFDVFLTPRVIGRIDAGKNVTLSQNFVPAIGDGMRSVYSTDGDRYWVTGGDAGLLNGTFATDPVQLFDPVFSTRCVHFYREGELLVSGSNIFNGTNGYAIWDGTSLNPIVAAGASSRDFHVVNENTFLAAASTSGRGMAKFVRDSGGAWSVAYSANFGFGLNSIAVQGNVIYATRSDGQAIVRFEDTGSSFTVPTVVAAATLDTRFRGVSFAPEAATETVLPSSYSVTRGVELGTNDVDKIRRNDDVFAVAEQRFQFAPTLANTEIQASFQVGQITGAEITVVIAANSLPFGDPSCRQEIGFRNVQTGQIEVIDSRKPTTSKQQIKVRLTPEQVQNFVTGAGQATVVARVFHLQPLSPAWTMRVDLASVEVSR
jgi:hypothetical protein